MMVAIRRFGIVVAFALVGVYAAVVLRGPQGILALEEKRREIRALQEENATLALENQRKQKRIEGLKKDPEMEIRKQLKLLRPGETSFILPEPPPTPAPSATPNTAGPAGSPETPAASPAQ